MPNDPLLNEALAMLPVAKEVMDKVRFLLPEGTDFSLFLIVRGKPEGRVLALHTDRDVMEPAVLQWVYHSVLSQKKDDSERTGGPPNRGEADDSPQSSG